MYQISMGMYSDSLKNQFFTLEKYCLDRGGILHLSSEMQRVDAQFKSINKRFWV